MRRRALAALPLLAAALALAAGLDEVPRAAAAFAGLCAAAGLLAAFAPAAAPPAWLGAGAAFAAAAAARLLGLWCGEPSWGFALCAAAAAAGAALASALPAPRDESSALAASAAGGLLAAAAPGLLRFLGQNSTRASALYFPPVKDAAFLLVQPALLLAGAAAALSWAARGLAAPAPKPRSFAPLLGAALGAAVIPRLDASAALGAAGAVLAAASALRARPWAKNRRPLPPRAAAAAAALALVFAAASPQALLQAWTARLDSLYPGGRFVVAADDGAVLWAAYEFPRGDRVLLRDGLVQRDSVWTDLIAAGIVLGQAAKDDCAVLIVNPPGRMSLNAAGQKCRTAVDDSPEISARSESFARAAALGSPPPPAPGDARDFTAAIVYLPSPATRAARRRLASRAALASVRGRLQPWAAAAIVVPALSADDRFLDAAEAEAAAAFGSARSARLASGDAVVLATAAEPTTDPARLYENLPPGSVPGEPDEVRKLLGSLVWRRPSSRK